MGVFDKLKDLVGIEDVEDDEELDEEIEETKKPERPASFDRPVSRPIVPSSPSTPVRTEPQRQEPAKTNTTKFTSQWKMEVTEPAGFDECPRLVDSLKAKKPVIINLENLETDIARKIFDFLSGATYALNGNVQKIANNIFVFAPENVTVAYKDNQKAETAEKPVRSPWA